jgi:hypothetical protein
MNMKHRFNKDLLPIIGITYLERIQKFRGEEEERGLRMKNQRINMTPLSSRQEGVEAEASTVTTSMTAVPTALAGMRAEEEVKKVMSRVRKQLAVIK